METKELNLEEKRALQISELEILKEFKRICEKNGLRYYLTAGTLLGAVRHGGFIPWDDDVDVSMPRKDYDYFCTLCYDELSTEYSLQNSWTEINFPYFFSKLRKNGTEVFEVCLAEVDINKGHYIDIFPLDICPESNFMGLVFFKLMGVFNSVYNAKVNTSFMCGYSKIYMRLLFNVLSLFSIEHIRKMREIFSSLPRVLCRGDRVCTVGGVHGYPAETFRQEWFGEAYMKFEDEQFSTPSGWDHILTNMYGDYMKIPSIEDQTGHFQKKE